MTAGATHTPGGPVCGRVGPLVPMPGRVPVPPGLGAVLTGRIKGPLSRVETVTGGIERRAAAGVGSGAEGACPDGRHRKVDGIARAGFEVEQGVIFVGPVRRDDLQLIR